MVDKLLNLSNDLNTIAGEILATSNKLGTLLINNKEAIASIIDIIGNDCVISDLLDSQLQVSKKLKKLQTTIEQVGLFEVHITVELCDAHIDRFISLCTNNNIKPIVISFDASERPNVKRQVMTSSTIRASNCDLWDYVKHIEDLLIQNEFTPIRTKVESPPWHSLAPQTVGEVMPQGSYFETHIPVTCKMIDSHKHEFDNSLKFFKHLLSNSNIECHLSKNALREDDTSWTRMVTLRDTKSLQEFEIKLAQLNDALNSICLKMQNCNTITTFKKSDIEFACFDTNISIDNDWFNKI